jgi:hypothetical protein
MVKFFSLIDLPKLETIPDVRGRKRLAEYLPLRDIKNNRTNSTPFSPANSIFMNSTRAYF